MPERLTFIHTYHLDEKRLDSEGNLIPDKLSRVCAISAAELYRNNLVYIIALGAYKDLSNAVQKRLEYLITNALKPDAIISTRKAYTTSKEVRELKKILKNHPEAEVTAICMRDHKERVEENYKRIIGDNKRIKIKSFDEVLKEVRNDDLYNDTIKAACEWEETKDLKKQEERVMKIKKYPIIGPFLVFTFWDLIPGKPKQRLQKWIVKI
jgi:hypothetical protein